MKGRIMPKKTGRPAFQITPEICQEAQALAAKGMAKYQIAESLGISYATLNNRENEFIEFFEAIAAGRKTACGNVEAALYDKAIEGDVPAIKYFMNNRDPDSWKDRRDVNMGGSVNHTFGEMSDEDLDEELANMESE